MNDQRVLIAGGGPVGLVCAYTLGLAGVPVVVFDENDELQEDPSVATTHPATLELLNAEWFSSIRQAQIVIDKLMRQYNHVRPHQALNKRPPVPETLLATGP